MANLPKPGRIRDPVHGYIEFTGIERALLDHPVAQRLRYVGQSAAAHLVFPDMRVSRLAHSLGAMHLASRFLQAALANANDPERKRIVAALHALVEGNVGLGLGDHAERTIMQQGLVAGRDGESADRVTISLVEQGLRLASLVHDLGHLPFSHDFEVALEEHLHSQAKVGADHAGLLGQAPGGNAIHERIGYALADVVQREVFNERLADTPLSKPAETALLIARDILHAPPVPELDPNRHAAVLRWLHSLVAGELDVDRADYVQRDVLHYGLAAAGYDLDRLVDNLVPITVDGRGIETAVLPQGVSAAEAFLVARFRMYAWAVYHHKIQQAAAGLRLVTSDILASGDHEVNTFLDDIAVIATGAATPEATQRFIDYDDYWWLGIMRQRLRDGVDPRVEPWLALFTRRRPGPVSLWKRAADFPHADRRAWNARLPHRDDLELRSRWEKARTDLRARGVLVERLPFRPWREVDGESVLQVRTHEGPPVPLTRLSALTRALGSAWGDELQVLAFAERPNLIDPPDVLAALKPALRT